MIAWIVFDDKGKKVNTMNVTALDEMHRVCTQTFSFSCFLLFVVVWRAGATHQQRARTRCDPGVRQER